MTEKRVSVRLSATGGRQVKAELEGVGEVGACGFGRLSREMEGANARLAAFAWRARVAMAAAAAAIAAAATATIRSGLQVIYSQAKLAASLGTTVESIQVLESAGDLAGVSMGAVEQAAEQLTRRLNQAAAGTGPSVDALTRLWLSEAELQALLLDQRIALIQDRLTEFVPEAERGVVASQRSGDRAGLVFSRIDTATLRQATQDGHGCLRDGPGAVGVFDPKQEIPAPSGCEQPVEQRRARAPDIQEPGGRRGETGDDGHGALTFRKPTGMKTGGQAWV